MLIPVFALLGALFGAWRARMKHGNRLDMAQYAAIGALIFGVLGTFLAIYIDRMN